ncbi:hypothetical protein HD554DRAFT_2169716 [Boletus coccyginus]|nr:hypothetical protein HD554DRAFT_2169716 [Boletus coccyginus]
MSRLCLSAHLWVRDALPGSMTPLLNIPAVPAPPISASSNHLQRSSQLEYFEPDVASSHLPPTRLQQTASFYNQPLHMDRSGHSLSAVPGLNDEMGPLIDELWEDLGSWHSVLHKKACTFVTQRYQWDPKNCCDHNIQITKNLLGNGGLFLKDGVDAEEHANNLAHPALSGLIIDFFYTSPTSVGKLFPEVFAREVPRVTVAIAATALKVVLDEVASGQGEVNFKVNTRQSTWKFSD